MNFKENVITFLLHKLKIISPYTCFIGTMTFGYVTDTKIPYMMQTLGVTIYFSINLLLLMLCHNPHKNIC